MDKNYQDSLIRCYEDGHSMFKMESDETCFFDNSFDARRLTISFTLIDWRLKNIIKICIVGCRGLVRCSLGGSPG